MLRSPEAPMTEHGITTSDAHYWLHVSPLEDAIFVYRRHEMLALIEKREDWRRSEIASAFGVLVPKASPHIWRFDWACGEAQTWRTAASDGAVGAHAEAVAKAWLHHPANLHHMAGDAVALYGCHYATDRLEQLKHDFVVRVLHDVRIEVKGDLRAADTGNLFVQTHERRHQWQKRHAHLADLIVLEPPTLDHGAQGL